MVWACKVAINYHCLLQRRCNTCYHISQEKVSESYEAKGHDYNVSQTFQDLKSRISIK